MNLCPEGEYRQSLPDDEFWAYVNRIYETYNDEDFEESEQTSDHVKVSCNVCGSLTACGYDSEGRPMIHVIEEDEDV